MAKTQIELNQESEHIIFMIKNKFGLNKPEATNLCLNILNKIYVDNPEKVYRLAETKNK